VNHERWVALGEVLRSDFQNLLGQYTTGCLTDDYLTAEDLQQLGALEAELSCFLQSTYELAALETGLTSGFMPGERPELGSESGGWTDRDSELFSPSSSQISSHFPSTRSESNAASSSYFQQKHSPVGNVSGNGQSAIPNVFNSGTLKEISRVSTEIVDTQEVNDQISPEPPRSPKGLKELAHLLTSQQPQKKTLESPFLPATHRQGGSKN
jgi:hypothetical protein